MMSALNLGLFLILILNGCVTAVTDNVSATDFSAKGNYATLMKTVKVLQERLGELERRAIEKDQELDALRNEIDSFKGNCDCMSDTTGIWRQCLL